MEAFPAQSPGALRVMLQPLRERALRMSEAAFGRLAKRPLADEAQLNDLGSVAMPGMVVGSLSNRLRVFEWITRHPEVRDECIDAPIVVIGMFRAGTTLLSRLFDQDAVALIKSDDFGRSIVSTQSTLKPLDQPGGQRHDRDKGFGEHAAESDQPHMRFLFHHLGRGARGNQRMEA